MAEFVIKAIDAALPTVTQWRNWLNTKALPEAQAWLAANPYTLAEYTAAHNNWAKRNEYWEARRKLLEGKDKLTPEEVTALELVVSQYEARPPLTTEEEKNITVLLDDISPTIPGRYDLFKYYRGLIDVDSQKTDADKAIELADRDRMTQFKRGMPVAIGEDGTDWGEGIKGAFVILKIPMVSVDKVREYIGEHEIAAKTYRRRLWQIQWASLPTVAKNKLRDNGMLTIKAPVAYTGAYDYTWTQIKQYLKNLDTNLFETRELL